jgi:hypothetical protein
MPSKEYETTGQIFRRLAQDTTDPTIAERLQALAEDYDRRAEVASRAAVGSSSKRVGRPKPSVTEQPGDKADQ